MSGYTKLFVDMLDSTVWQLSKEARLLWITMLLKKGRDQIVRVPLPGLWHAARLGSIEETEVALLELSAPDKYSHTADHEGRRILKVPEGWLVVNGAKYRNMLGPEDRRDYQRIKQAEYRQKKKVLESTAQPASGAEGELAQSLVREIGAKIYGRPEGQWPTEIELRYSLEVVKRPEWISEKARILELSRIVTPEDRRFELPKSLSRLLVDWSGTLDKARNYKPHERNRKHNTRNDGVAVGPTDYGEAAKRKLERQALAAKNERASEAAGT